MTREQEQQRRRMHPAFQDALRAVRERRSVPKFNDNYLNSLLSAYASGISERQVCIGFNAWVHGFNVSDIDVEIARMVGEVSKVLDARAKCERMETVWELADVIISCYSIAQMFGMDLDEAIAFKMDELLERNYCEPVQLEEDHEH